VCVLDGFKLVIIIVVIIMGCAVFSVFSSFLYGHVVAGIFRLADCDAGFIVGAPRGWFCVGTLRTHTEPKPIIMYNINNPLLHKIM
jgi:hypothetical protein